MDSNNLSGRPKVGSPALEVHNIAFEFWMQFWTAVFKKNGLVEKPNADDFLRQISHLGDPAREQGGSVAPV
jgi:hypothetical protein